MHTVDGRTRRASTARSILTGFRDDHGGEHIDPTAVRFAASRAKQETEVSREHRLKKEEESTTRGAPGKGGEDGGKK